MKAPPNTLLYFTEENHAPPLTHGAQFNVVSEGLSFHCLGKALGCVELIRSLCAKGKMPMLIERIEPMMNVDHALRRDGSC